MAASTKTQHREPDIRLIHNVRFRAWVIQALVLVLLLTAAGYAVYNTGKNLQKAGVTTGFGFLEESAGFDIGLTLIQYSRNSTYFRAFLVGILNTLLVSALSIILSTLLGFTLGVLRLSPNWLVSRMAAVYTEIIRNIPLLLQILFWYLAILAPLPGPRQALELLTGFFLCNRGLIMPQPVPEPGFYFTLTALLVALVFCILLWRWNRRRQKQTGRVLPVYRLSFLILIGLPLAIHFVAGSPLHWEMPALKGFNFQGGMTLLPELIALWLAISLYAATFIGEFVRSGILAVHKGQMEAAQALGYRPFLAYRLIIIPQAMRVVTPPLISQYLTIVKNSSLAVVIGYPDLVHVFAGTALNQSGQAVEIIAMTMAVYLVVSLIISLFMNWFNQKYVLKGG